MRTWSSKSAVGQPFRVEHPLRLLARVRGSLTHVETNECNLANRTGTGVVLRLSDIVDRDVVSLSHDMPLADGIELMRRSRVEIAPVLHTGKVVGVVSLRALESSTNQSSSRIRDVTPGSYATYQALAPETELDTAFELAREAGAEFVLVLDQGRLIGIVPTRRIEVSMGASPPT